MSDPTISVVIASYGERRWRDLALSRAYPSAHRAGAEEIVCEHQPDGDIASARNAAAERATGEFLVFLDADDELSEGYIEAMRSQAAIHGERKMYAPAVSYVVQGRAQPPKFWPERPLREGNWLVIGTMVPRRVFEKVGGFEPWPLAYEDWHLFCKVEREGVGIVRVPEAVYRAHWQPGSRNRSFSREEAVRIHYEVGRSLYPDYYTPLWLAQHLRRWKRR